MTTSREPAVAEGSRSLTSWIAIRADLDRHPELRDQLLGDPGGVLARYGIRGSAEEIRMFVDAILGLRTPPG